MNEIQSYVTKKDYIYSILKCNPKIFIPTNDFDVWNNSDKYIAWLWVYDKLQLTLSQNIPCGPVGTYPKEYPIVVKPISFGMGMHAQKIDSLLDYKNTNKSGMFWMPHVVGKHYRIDLILQAGKIVWHSIFQGHNEHPNNHNHDYPLGIYSHWELQSNTPVPNNIRNWVNDTFLKQSYTGCVNIEYIGNTITECHLRMGDINQIDMYYYFMCKNKVKIFPSIIELYKTGIWNLPEKFVAPKKLFIVPVYVQQSEYELFKNNLTRANVYQIANKTFTTKKRSIFMLQKDPPPPSPPPPSSHHHFKVFNQISYVRICNISTIKLSAGVEVKNEIIKFLGNNVALYKKITNGVTNTISNTISNTTNMLVVLFGLLITIVLYLCVSTNKLIE